MKFHNCKFELVTEEHEMRMSHWVKGVAIIDTESRNEILNLTSFSWSLVSYEIKNYSIDLLVAHYPNQDRQVNISANLYEGTAKLSKPSKLKIFDSLVGSQNVQLVSLHSELEKFI
ncbi:hypothetical protein [Pseudoalteromonas xiamenensis]